MRKATRLFDIIQLLRRATRPLTAADIAATLEVGQRTIYRDIVALQSMRVHIDGERGLGYILRPGFDLPPLMFTADETEALVVALALLRRTGDTGLHSAARSASDKIASALPAPLHRLLDTGSLHAWGTPAPSLDLTLLRRAIRDEASLHLSYTDDAGDATDRTVRPIALIYYSAHATLVGWCELRQAIRNFRTDRIGAVHLSGNSFAGQGDALRALWVGGWTTT